MGSFCCTIKLTQQRLNALLTTFVFLALAAWSMATIISDTAGIGSNLLVCVTGFLSKKGSASDGPVGMALDKQGTLLVA
ncbi:MAG: hypothetical protein A3I83_03920 [Methylotenera sp. RIFCSPLOWO2_02_FULL_45_14]|nr:MAG: hypothetical protein A3I83_03920 [Methylotenera sp. RIFCSPLOWO2_02_FULL_45_14]